MVMETEKKLKVLQMFYAGVLADSVLRMGNEGILAKVTNEKRNEQLLTGKIRAEQLGIERTEQVFEILSDIFACSNWRLEKNTAGFVAEATQCMLCAMAKRIGSQSPCHIYCLDAMEGMVKGINPEADYQVESTLWENGQCRVVVKQNATLSA